MRTTVNFWHWSYSHFINNFKLGESQVPLDSTGGTTVPTGEITQAENTNATNVPLQPAIVSIPDAVPSGTSIQRSPGSSYVSPIVAEINAHLRCCDTDMQSGSQ